MDNKAKKPQANKATEILENLKGKSTGEQLSIMAEVMASQQTLSEHQVVVDQAVQAQAERLEQIVHSQEELSRLLEEATSKQATQNVSDAAQVDKKKFTTGLRDTLSSKPVIITAGVVGAAALAGASYYAYGKYQDHKSASDVAEQHVDMLEAPMGDASMSQKDAAVAAALGDR